MSRWLLIVCLAGFPIWHGARFAEAKPPNILHLHTDDFRPNCLGAFGHPVVKTPNLDTLVTRGFAFRNCYTQGSLMGAVCLPSRTMMLTGRSWLRIPKAKAALPDANDPETYLPRVMNKAGYQSLHVGKGGNEFRAGLEKFDSNLVYDDRAVEQRRYASPRATDAVIAWLHSRQEGKQFYIYMSPSVPHDPRVAPKEFMDQYDPSKIPLLPAFMPLHPFDNGEMTVRDEMLAPWPRTPEDTRKQLAEYYACITCFDHHVGRIFAALKEIGEFDNTIIVFTGDNGLSMGEHGLFGKQNLYEFGGMHVPCIFAGPGIPHGESTALTYLMDLLPTFAELGGAKPPTFAEGKSLAPVMQGKTPRVRDVLYTGYAAAQRAIRDDRWKLIRYPLVDVTQLFDLQADPHELNNLAGKPEHAAQVTRMMALLAEEQARYGDDYPLKVVNPKPAAWTPPMNQPATAGGK